MEQVLGELAPRRVLLELILDGSPLLQLAQRLQVEDDKAGKVLCHDTLRPAGTHDAQPCRHEHLANETRDGLLTAARLVDAVDHQHKGAHLERHRQHRQPLRPVGVFAGQVPAQHRLVQTLGGGAAALEHAREALHVHQRWHERHPACCRRLPARLRQLLCQLHRRPRLARARSAFTSSGGTLCTPFDGSRGGSSRGSRSALMLCASEKPVRCTPVALTSMASSWSFVRRRTPVMPSSSMLVRSSRSAQ
mmetsp:Transcript_37238/g.109124  ORF Transcript_37238/g.109124 Transcript_37238/m.109124 type:complete len:249 (+) Transcript_37238:1193-1939(+)